MAELLTLTSNQGETVSVEPKTLSILGGIDLASVGLLVARPLITSAINSLANSGELDELELTAKQKEILVDKVLNAIDKVVKKVK